MIFRHGMAVLIVKGKKTQTRRLVKPDEEECRYKAGQTYALQPGRTAKAWTRILVLDVRREPLGAITFDDARREGFKTLEMFVAYWKDLHGYHDPAQDVWVITFELDPKPPARFLHKDSMHSPTKTSAPGYTTDERQALAGEIEEAVDGVTLQVFAEDARRRHSDLHREEELRQEARSLSRRLREETLRTGRAGVDVTHELEQIRTQLAAMERKRLHAA